MKPFQFENDGSRLEAGQIACVPAYDIMHNEVEYPHPHDFDGLRFMKGAGVAIESQTGGEMRGTTLTDGSKDFPIWGYGSKIW